MKLTLALCCFLYGMLAVPARAQQSAPETLRINTELVTLSVGVMDTRGNPLNHLTQRNFAIYEDGRQQSIEFFGKEDQPISFGLLLDQSQSMGQAGKLEQAKAAALAFLRAGNPLNEAFCLAFNDTLTLLADFTSDYPRIETGLARVVPAGGTALYDAIITGLDKLATAKHRRRVLLVITDGRDEHSRHQFSELIKRAQQSDAAIYALGFYSPVEAEAYRSAEPSIVLVDGRRVENPRFVFQTLAEETGAVTFFPKTAAELGQAMTELATSLRRQYTLAYYPIKQERDDRYRRIEVRLQHTPPAQIRTRQGYRLTEPVGFEAAAARTKVTAASTRPPVGNTLTAELTVPRFLQTAELAPPIFKEKFEQTGDWLRTDKCYVEKGRYYANGDCLVPVKAFVYDDFELEVVAAVLTGGERTNQGGLGTAAEEVKLPTSGLLFRLNQAGYYRLSVAPLTGGKEGIYKLVKIVDGKQIELTSWRRDAAITTRNLIRLRCVGGKLELSINNLRVAEFKDASFNAGRISLFFSGGLGTFDDLVIKKLSK